MEGIHFLDLFQGIATLVASEPKIMFGRIFLMLLGFLLIYLGSKNVLEPLLMIPMGLGMSSVNAGVMFLEGKKMGTLFVDPLMSDPIDLMNIMQIDWLQPIYTLTFSNGLIACLVFMGIGVLLDVGYVMARPFQSIFIALFAELGTIAVFPIAIWLGLNPGQSAAVATIGGADVAAQTYPGHLQRRRRPAGEPLGCTVRLGSYGRQPVPVLAPSSAIARGLTPACSGLAALAADARRYADNGSSSRAIPLQ